ncbi:DUF6406 domain-containing protein [Streptomyces sp. NPDC048370]|uniref:DUF6406 domain-containing protein n=1 Tax=Streptomyces sp. NPDC048370 TaxID=3365540 RepID=UPI00371AC2FB
MINEVWLWPRVVGDSDNARFSVIHLYAPADEPLSIQLLVAADAEHTHTLHVGDMFPVRDETWKFERVDNLESERWLVLLRKVV